MDIMPKTLSDYFWVAASALIGDITVFGTLGLGEYIGHAHGPNI